MATPKQLHAIIDEVSDQADTNGNVIQFTYQGIGIMLVYDENADRMRLIAPISELTEVDDEMLLKAMQANFHSALDARYAVSQGAVWAAFIHPLADLSEQLFRSAIHQVAVARATFGDQYTSGELIFNSGDA